MQQPSSGRVQPVLLAHAMLTFCTDQVLLWPGSRPEAVKAGAWLENDMDKELFDAKSVHANNAKRDSIVHIV